ncbi:MAG: isoleucine--tRNA ligase [Christensenellales bacterium]|jgi:isoleucyl-tRNA synthetase|nr:isoleucine--tRNA ligase [Eubacteriales bacterium]
MYKPVDSSLDFVSREKATAEFWKNSSIFEKSVQKNEGGPEFSFYDGPPTANGKPHIGHVLTRVIKDIIPRYKTMKGYHVLRKAGWDTHGLPVELEVEKSLGLNGKQDIEKYGVEPFIKKCRESVWKYKAEWEKMSGKVGYWADMKNPYITYEDDYIESVWWSLKEIDKQGLLYKGHKIVPYCPRCGTALSSHEVAQGYKDVEEKSIFVKFKVEGEENTYYLAWTTTPWTLPSNVALAMNPKEDYSKIKAGGEYYYLASALVPSLFSDYETVETKKGKDFERRRYIPLFDYVKDTKDAFYITVADFVTLTDGSGIVHIAPAFGEDDAAVGKKYRLPFVQLVDTRGRFVAEAYDLFETFAKDADKIIIEKLKARGQIFKELMFTHSYPYCWRCDTPLLYYARSSWFIAMTKVRAKLLKNNASVNWMPPSIGTGRMGNFLENVIDWGISRERYWGTPLPIWVCEKCGKIHVVGSKAELKELAGLKSDLELHRPYIDAVKFECECGGIMKREPEVLDCWYDSGSMPFAQWHYPFENKATFDEVFPADFISEAVDQTRGWFYTLLAISTLLFDRSPFKNCIVLGHVNDKDGIKMSKHKHNVIEPDTVLDSQGADAVRWYFYTGSAPWLPSRFYPEAVSEAQRKFMGTLWNTYAFFVLYAEIDSFNPAEHPLKEEGLTVMDRWILSELNSLIRFVDESLNEYKITESARRIQDFVDDLSNWYVRRGRERYWGSEMTEDKLAAYTTLWTVLTELSKLSAPFVPFLAEELYQNLVVPFFPKAPESVHLADFPVFDEKYIDENLSAGMKSVLKLVVLGRAARNRANLKNRQPLEKLMYKGIEDDISQELLSLAADELNVKNIEAVTGDRDFITYELKPQLKTLGPKYGKLLGKIRAFLDTADGFSVVDATENGGVFKVELDGTIVELSRDDLLISVKNRTGFVSESEGGVTVILDTNLTEELISEGFERELISKIQTMRKEAGFKVTDRIKVGYQASGKTLEALEKGGFLAVVLADSATPGLSGYIKEWDINGETATLSVEKVEK